MYWTGIQDMLMRQTSVLLLCNEKLSSNAPKVVYPKKGSSKYPAAGSAAWNCKATTAAVPKTTASPT